MTRRRALIAIAPLLLIGAGIAAFAYFRSADAPAQFQGWVEADIVFVSPDEIGRVATLSVREGSTVEVGSPLFTLDDDLQQAAVAENEAAVTNARQAYDRAEVLLKKAVGSQKDFDNAEALLRSAQARLNSTKTRLDRRRMLSPVGGDDPGGLLPRRRDGRTGPADPLDRAAGQRQGAFLRAAGDAAKHSHWGSRADPVRRLPQ